jgi:hypothetical protein
VQGNRCEGLFCGHIGNNFCPFVAAIAGGIFGHHPIFHQLPSVMFKKRFALLGASLLGALLGASTTSPIPTTGPIEVGAISDHGPTYTPRTFAAEKPAPAKPVAQPVAPRQVAVKAPIMSTKDFTRFIERPGRRKVRYGKNRWVILG